MSTLFTKIIQGDIPCHKIAESDAFFAFLDIRPIAPAHTLVIPKLEVDRFFDMPTTYLEGILSFAKPIAEAIESIIPCERVGMMVAGLEVPHAHLHLVPIREIGDLNFANAKEATSDSLRDVHRQLTAILGT